MSDKNIYGRHLAARVVLELTNAFAAPDQTDITTDSITRSLALQYDVRQGVEFASLKKRVRSILKEMIEDGTLAKVDIISKKKTVFYKYTQFNVNNLRQNNTAN